MQSKALTVRQLNFYVKSLLEGDPRLSNICVIGEISNLKSHYSSGHIYFTLKDSDAAIRCVMFRSFAARVKFAPQDGMQVVLRGRASLYEKDGQYQFYAEEMLAAGQGDIALQFEQTKAKLEAEGLFNPETKRRLPKFPKRIAVITSSSGAAVQDIMNILARRWPIAEIVLCPVSVQGESAVPEMLDTLDRLYRLSGIDLAIIGRGGGSIEDLWAFNSERLARKIYESPFPIISAVGHETDFTICDFVSDLRAPTPSAAAELAVPDKAEILSLLTKTAAHLKTLLSSRKDYAKARLEACISSHFFKNPKDAFIYKNAETLDRLSDRLLASIKNKLDLAELALSKKAVILDALSPLKTISRGFAAVKKDGRIISTVENLNERDNIELIFADGKAECEVKKITRGGINGGK
ncbi:MAG: exodeoxyribonuclease VII large subunit [Acutalibacteraceae bacterium]|jgi:exodeoxyribonuclease VII large subunit